IDKPSRSRPEGRGSGWVFLTRFGSRTQTQTGNGFAGKVEEGPVVLSHELLHGDELSVRGTDRKVPFGGGAKAVFERSGEAGVPPVGWWRWEALRRVVRSEAPGCGWDAAH
ncbi:hypothetical protein, partial [Streptomyces sp. NPDC056069]|uniref:hypothetical protein n=1 Tax=Streptomyces sp. NPDC056069 TaxID=3345702 RepID=UPI0035E3431D